MESWLHLKDLGLLALAFEDIVAEAAFLFVQLSLHVGNLR